MPELRRILCPVDLSEFSMRAYRHALSVASHYNARLFVQHVVEPWRHNHVDYAPSPELYDEFCRTLRENAEKELQQFVRACAHDEVQIESVVQDGIVTDNILAFAKGQNVDLIVMGTHGRRGFDRLMLGSVTERVMRRAACPVLTVNKPSQDLPDSDRPLGPIDLNRIFFCTDFSENSRRALDYAISLMEEYEAELTLLHVLEQVPSPDMILDALAAATEQLHALISPDARNPSKGKSEIAVRIGKPYQQIIQAAAETRVDLVIMAVRGRGALDLALFGSTTYRVMQFGSCPVLVVHV